MIHGWLFLTFSVQAWMVCPTDVFHGVNVCFSRKRLLGSAVERSIDLYRIDSPLELLQMSGSLVTLMPGAWNTSLSCKRQALVTS